MEGGETNMKNKIIAFSIFALSVGALIFGAANASAYKGDPNIQGPNYTPERHEQMTEAFNNNDYNAWVQLMQGNGRVTQVVNEGNFARFTEMHKLMLEGKTEEANAIRTELGLGLHDGSGQHNTGRYGRNNI